MNGAVSNLATFPERWESLGRELRHGGYDVVHVHEPNAPLVSWYAAEARACRWWHLPPYSTSGLANSVRRELHRRAPALQQAARPDRRLRGRALDRAALLRRPLPDHPERRRPRRAPGRRRGRSEELRIAFVGPRGGAQGLARPAARVRGAARRRRAGAADRRRRRRPRRSSRCLLDPEGVDIVGQVDEEEKWRLLGEADLLCAPSLGGESFGMVLTEAFASGTP